MAMTDLRTVGAPRLWKPRLLMLRTPLRGKNNFHDRMELFSRRRADSTLDGVRGAATILACGGNMTGVSFGSRLRHSKDQRGNRHHGGNRSFPAAYSCARLFRQVLEIVSSYLALRPSLQLGDGVPIGALHAPTNAAYSWPRDADRQGDPIVIKFAKRHVFGQVHAANVRQPYIACQELLYVWRCVRSQFGCA